MCSFERDKLLERFRDAADKIAIAFPADMTIPNEACSWENLLGTQARRLLQLVRPDGAEHAVPPIDEQDIKHRLDQTVELALGNIYAFPYHDIADKWLLLYTNSQIMMSYFLVARWSMEEEGVQEDPQTLWDAVVENLDRALITAGGRSQCLEEGWIEETMKLLPAAMQEDEESDPRRNKRRKTVARGDFSTVEPHGRPTLKEDKTCLRHEGWDLDPFMKYMNGSDPVPAVFTDLISHWPAFDDHPWKSIDYLLSQTLGGRRLVPIEIGRSYIDDEWGQEVIPFRELLDKYILDDPHGEEYEVGYLAQHNLFNQIPSLRNDIQIPDFCWTDVPGHPTDATKNQPQIDEPKLNAWFGPAKTITPLHTDGYHNLLCQVVGYKYVRLYPPSATDAMMPMKRQNGIDMSNTATVDVGIYEGWDEAGEDWDEESLEEMRKALKDVEYWECILGPGDTLLIPMGWWHYVRSLSVSFSVSFWWN